MLSDYFEIAYAAASGRLCLLTGTGFSRAVTGDQAPGWQKLLVDVCESPDGPIRLKSVLFPADKENPLGLEEAAQVIDIELQKSDKRIHTEIAQIVRKLKLSGDNRVISSFLEQIEFNVITTNYDKLLEELVGENNCQSIVPGFPVPRSKSRVQVYHVHGSVDSPGNMIVASEDYFKFERDDSYFSRKLSTLVHENIVVILGYSFRDSNLKAILSDHKGFSRDHVIGHNVFLVSRRAIDQDIKDYYSHCYGIRVLDQQSVREFFQLLEVQMPKARGCTESSQSSIRRVLNDNHMFTDDFLKMEYSFFEIMSSISAVGKRFDEPRVVETLGRIIEKKIALTNVDGAWTQYVHLAKWLIHIASRLELRGTSIEQIFLNAALRSMITMSQRLVVGYSWHAYTEWERGWKGIISSNRTLIREHIIANLGRPDALAVVNQC